MTKEEKIAAIDKVIEDGKYLLNQCPELDFSNIFETAINPEFIKNAFEQWLSECSKTYEDIVDGDGVIDKQLLTLAIFGKIQEGEAMNEYGNYRNAIIEAIKELEALKNRILSK